MITDHALCAEAAEIIIASRGVRETGPRALHAAWGQAVALRTRMTVVGAAPRGRPDRSKRSARMRRRRLRAVVRDQNASKISGLST